MPDEELKEEEQLTSAQLTPMVRQYQEIKARHRDKILLFRVGDFYEMFFDDAKEAAQILNIALTARNDMPMAGFPYHAAAQYIYKLISAGKKAAVCEQLEDPSKAKGLVKRDIVSIVTPGTVIDDNYLGKKQNNYLLSIYGNAESLALSFIDISTGDSCVLSSKSIPTGNEKYRVLQDEIARFSPSEIIYNEKLKDDPGINLELQNSGVLYEAFPEWYFEDFSESSKKLNYLKEIKDVPVLRKSLLGAVHYLFETQGGSVNINADDFYKNIQSVLNNTQIMNKNSLVEMDDFTIRNLELIKNMQDGGRKFTLLEVLDSTITPMGGRLLRAWILMPLYDKQKIYERQNFTEAFFDDGILTAKVRDILKKISDIERLSARIALKRVIPRELPSLSSSLKHTVELKNILISRDDLKSLAGQIIELNDVSELIDRSILEEPSSTFGGEVIKEGYDEELDRLRKMMREGKDWIIKLQNQEREKTGINSLKVKYNNIFGYFIEISKANLDGVPPHYIRKQSLVNAERYTIPELSEYEMQINSATEKVVKLEEEIFSRVVDEVAQKTPLLQKIAHTVALIDIYSNFAVTAKENNYVKPSITEEGDFHIIEGRHAVVEKYMGKNLFVPNDTILDNDENRILILTGPNMAGKSTYLRQNALISVMAQIGSFVPAREARIGLVDKIFTRIGASDNLAQGQSTFLVEMREAANILRNSTKKSLIIMDELGRGTSTYDGLSIAWAVVEYLHEHPEKGGKTLFATHYHELTRLGEKKGIQNYNIAVREYKDELVFLRKVIAGPADRSYGIYVAKLAGIPQEIIDRAKIILETLEAGGNQAKNRIESIFDKEYRKSKQELKTSSEIDLFTDQSYQNIIDKIRNIDINRITPLEAITFLAELKKLIK